MSRSPSSLCSFPLTLRVPPKSLGKFRIAFAAANRALHQIDPPSQISEPGGARNTVKGGRHGAQH